MTQDCKMAIQQMFDEVWNKSDLSFVDQIYGQDYVGHITGAPKDIEGLEHLKQFIALHAVLTSDLNFRVDDQIAEGDRVASRWTATTKPTAGVTSKPVRTT